MSICATHRAKAAARQLSLGADQRGAMALLGLFMAVFLTSAVFYVVGIGEAVLYRERMQDAADTAAFSAAVLHARGMNLLALLNMLMAALLAILVALKLVKTIMSLAIVLISIASIFGAPALASAIPTLRQLHHQVSRLHTQMQPRIYRMIETLHAAGVAVRSVVPAASMARGHAIARAYDDSPVLVAVPVPARSTLPTRDGEFSDLCDKAGDYVGDLASSALLIVPDAVAEPVRSAISSLSSAGALWVCGGGAAPSVEVTETIHHPVLPSVQACEQMNPEQADYDERRHRKICDRADRERHAARPDDHTGTCTGDCQLQIYEQRAALARHACAPRRGNDPLRDFEWQERRFTRTYVMHRRVWRIESDRETERASESLRLRDSDTRPCGRSRAPVGPQWNVDARDHEGRPVPLCSNARPPQTALADEGDVRSVEHIEVSHLFGCTERVRRRFDAGDETDDEPEDVDDGNGGGDGAVDEKVPQLLLDEAHLGDDHFQVRAIVLGKARPSAPQRLIELASWRQQPGAALGLIGELGAALGRTSVAQAEYFYALEHGGPYARANLLWNMRWQARLRRVRLPEPAAGGSAASSREEIVSICDDALRAGDLQGRDGDISCGSFERIFDLIVH